MHPVIVRRLYSFIKFFVRNSIRKCAWDKALSRISLAARYAYTYNDIYTDDELEQYLKVIADKLLLPVNKTSASYKNRFVFYNSFCVSDIGLAHQYLRAMISWDAEFLYIFGQRTNSTERLYEEVKSYPKAEIYFVEQGVSLSQQVQSVYKKIVEYNPNKAFLYLLPWDTIPVCVFNALPDITKYQINLTDHAFWLGRRCSDYTIEFTNRGCTISLEKRGFCKKQLLFQPFYPIADTNSFAGFPNIEIDNRIIIFSGGAYYKISGSNIYFQIVKHIIEKYPNVVFLYAGFGNDSKVKQFIIANKYEKRFILLGQRNDINEVFAHCDIYLGTYPIGGGLMTQYAAMNGKPLLCFTDSQSCLSDLFIRSEKGINYEFSDLNLLYQELDRLIVNENYRKYIGKVLSHYVITPSEFNSQLKELIDTNSDTRHTFIKVPINYEEVFVRYCEIDSASNDRYLTFAIIKTLKFYSLFIFPKRILKSIPILIKKLFESISNKHR